MPKVNTVTTIYLIQVMAFLALCMCLVGCTQEVADTQTVETKETNDHAAVVKASSTMVPLPPWSAGDQRGMANTLGVGTLMRCAFHLNRPGARIYELSHLRSNEMPSSPWVARIQYEYSPTLGLPNSIIAYHPGVKVTGVSGAQGTQMDAFGHWGYLDEIWDGE